MSAYIGVEVHMDSTLHPGVKGGKKRERSLLVQHGAHARATRVSSAFVPVPLEAFLHKVSLKLSLAFV